jgi:hypothetical protein
MRRGSRHRVAALGGFSPSRDFYSLEYGCQIVSCFGSRTRRREKPWFFKFAHPLPALRLDAPQRRPMVLLLRTRMEHLRYWRRVPRVPTPVDFDAVPLVRSLVATLRVVCALTLSRAAANPIPLPKPKPRATGLPLIMPPIHSREVARAQRSGVRHGEDAL